MWCHQINFEPHVCKPRIGADLAKIFTGYVTREYGEKAVDIPNAECGILNAEWKTRLERPARLFIPQSAFGNPHSDGSGGMSEKMRTTYSMWSAFRNCRKACEWRYLKELVPLESDHNLAFGAVIHTCLELWHRHRDLDRVLEHLDRTYASRCCDEKLLAEWRLATAMVKAYAARYPEEDFEIVALEKGFEEKIVNPATGAPEQLRISD